MKTGTKIWLCIAGVLFIAIGVICIIRPDITLLSAAWLLGIMTLLAGISKLVFTFKTQAFMPNSGSRMLISLLEIFFGIFFLFHIFETTLSLPVMFAVMVIIEGISAAAQSFEFKKIGFSSWWGILLLGIVAIVLGILGLKNFDVTAKTLSTLIGLSIIFTGVAHILAVVGVSKLEKNITNQVNVIKDQMAQK
jgi:uncharacterized membrane protein HdeD (DUF308 family)